MRPPKRIVIGNHVFKVKFRDGVSTPEGADAYGVTNHRDTTMTISRRNAPSQIRDTVFHEVLHAVINDGPAGLDHETEEQLIRAVTPALLGVLRNNPQLLEFLLEE